MAKGTTRRAPKSVKDDGWVNDGATERYEGTLSVSEASRQAGVPHGQFISDPALDPAQQPQPEDTEEPDALNPEKQPQPRAPLHALGARPAISNRGLPEHSRPEPDGPMVESVEVRGESETKPDGGNRPADGVKNRSTDPVDSGVKRKDAQRVNKANDAGE